MSKDAKKDDLNCERRTKTPMKKLLMEKEAKTDMHEVFYEPYMYILDLSPSDAIHEHAKAVFETVNITRKMYKAYLNGEFTKADKHFQKVSLAEFKADNIKSIIRDRMPRGFFSTIPKDDMNILLNQQDSIADSAEDVADLLFTYHNKPREDIACHLEEHMDMVYEGIKLLTKAVDQIDDAFMSLFRRKEIDKVLSNLHLVSLAEHEADKIKFETRKLIYNQPHDDTLIIYHQLKLLQRVDDIINHAENVEARIRAIIGG